MKRKDFKKSLCELSFTLDELVKDDGVNYCSALYGLLLSASCIVLDALNHIEEYEENE